MNIIPFPQRPEMNLELLEQTCLNYLSDTRSPIVPVESLLEFLRRTPALAQVSAETLLDFLRKHDDFKVLDGPTPEEQVTAELLGTAGVAMGPRVVLTRRIPSERELHAHLAVQLQGMRDALDKTYANTAPGPKRTEIKSAMTRVDNLLERLASILR